MIAPQESRTIEEIIQELAVAVVREVGNQVGRTLGEEHPAISVSVATAAKMVHRGRSKVQRAIEAGELMAMTEDGETQVIVDDLHTTTPPLALKQWAVWQARRPWVRKR